MDKLDAPQADQGLGGEREYWENEQALTNTPLQAQFTACLSKPHLPSQTGSGVTHGRTPDIGWQAKTTLVILRSLTRSMTGRRFSSVHPPTTNFMTLYGTLF